MYFGVGSSVGDRESERIESGSLGVKQEPVTEAPLTMLIPMLVFAALVILLGLLNGEIVSRFIEPIIPVRLLR